jgi:hypothetical protein
MRSSNQVDDRCDERSGEACQCSGPSCPCWCGSPCEVSLRTQAHHVAGMDSAEFPKLRVRWLVPFVPWPTALLEKSPLPPEEAAVTANRQLPTSRRAVLIVPASLRFMVIPDARQASLMACIA